MSPESPVPSPQPDATPGDEERGRFAWRAALGCTVLEAAALTSLATLMHGDLLALFMVLAVVAWLAVLPVALRTREGAWICFVIAAMGCAAWLGLFVYVAWSFGSLLDAGVLVVTGSNALLCGANAAFLRRAEPYCS